MKSCINLNKTISADSEKWSGIKSFDPKQKLPEFGEIRCFTFDKLPDIDESETGSPQTPSVDRESQQEKLYLTEETIMTEGIGVYWTNLCNYYPERQS